MIRTDTRRAVSLVEMVVTIGVGSIIFGLTIMLLGSTLRAERTSRKHFSETETIGRLASQFRQDVHAAMTAEMNSESLQADAVRLSGSDGVRIDYQWTEHVVSRESFVGDQPNGREQYQLPTIAAAHFATEDFSGRRIAMLTLESHADETNGRVRRNLRIEAVLGKTVSEPPASTR